MHTWLQNLRDEGRFVVGLCASQGAAAVCVQGISGLRSAYPSTPRAVSEAVFSSSYRNRMYRSNCCSTLLPTWTTHGVPLFLR